MADSNKLAEGTPSDRVTDSWSCYEPRTSDYSKNDTANNVRRKDDGKWRKNISPPCLPFDSPILRRNGRSIVTRTFLEGQLLSDPAGINPHPQSAKHHCYADDHCAREILTDLEKCPRPCENIEEEGSVQSLQQVVHCAESRFYHSAMQG